MLEIKGYITNLGKYNEGILIGEYITFPIDEDELEKVFKRIGINEQYEEFFFTDWDCSINLGFGEYESIDKINEIAEVLSDWDEDLLAAACEIWNLDEVLDDCPDAYYHYSDINTDYDLGYYWVVESGCYDLDNLGFLSNYIDYEAFGRDYRLQSNGGFTNYGWIEYNG